MYVAAPERRQLTARRVTVAGVADGDGSGAATIRPGRYRMPGGGAPAISRDLDWVSSYIRRVRSCGCRGGRGRGRRGAWGWRAIPRSRTTPPFLGPGCRVSPCRWRGTEGAPPLKRVTLISSIQPPLPPAIDTRYVRTVWGGVCYREGMCDVDTIPTVFARRISEGGSCVHTDPTPLPPL